jgi:membrane protein required for colicin V production
LSLFDLIAGALIVISALVGYQRGAVREVVGLCAFALSALATLALLPITTKIAGKVFHPHWVAMVAAVVVGFAVVYLAIMLLSRWVSSGLSRQTLLGGLNQAVGLCVGAARALVLLGLFALVFDRAIPEGLQPPWVTGAFFYPLAGESGRVMARLAPAGLGAIGHPGVLLNGEHSPDTTRPDTTRPDTTQTDQTGASATTSPPKPRTRHRGAGYDQNSRTEIDDLVERTR